MGIYGIHRYSYGQDILIKGTLNLGPVQNELVRS